MGWFYIAILIAFVVILFLAMRSLRRRKENASRTCRHCGSRIPFNAEICPVCGLRPGNDYRAENKVYGGQILKELKWVLIGGAVFVIVCYILMKCGVDLGSLFRK
ncbi:MAG: hypothetical protein IJJ85_02645 [Clostridia bacterium]|nr:hypothetical protein [Clostridia bacterium]